MRRRGEDGTVSVLIIGLAFVVVLLVAVVVDTSAAYLRREGLNSVADAAALAATDGLQGDQVYRHGLGSRAEIDADAARGYVDDYFRTSGVEARFPGLTYVVEAVADTVIVRVTAPLHLPFRVPGVADDALIRGTAASVVVVSP